MPLNTRSLLFLSASRRVVVFLQGQRSEIFKGACDFLNLHKLVR